MNIVYRVHSSLVVFVEFLQIVKFFCAQTCNHYQVYRMYVAVLGQCGHRDRLLLCRRLLGCYYISGISFLLSGIRYLLTEVGGGARFRQAIARAISEDETAATIDNHALQRERERGLPLVYTYVAHRPVVLAHCVVYLFIACIMHANREWTLLAAVAALFLFTPGAGSLYVYVVLCVQHGTPMTTDLIMRAICEKTTNNDNLARSRHTD